MRDSDTDTQHKRNNYPTNDIVLHSLDSPRPLAITPKASAPSAGKFMNLE